MGWSARRLGEAGWGTLVGMAVAIVAGLCIARAVPAEPMSIVDAAFAAGDCARCHEVPHQPALARTDSCQGCHVWIRGVSADPAKRAKAVQIFPLWERYEKNVATYLQVPRLDAAMARLEPEWVRDYLTDPHDLRPALPETMPRMALSPAQIEALVGAFAAATAAVPTTPPPRRAHLERGEALFVERGCAGCHTFGGRHAGPGVAMAPDLAHTRKRMHPDRIVAWIRNPQAVSPAATMPALGLTEDEAIALRDYLWFAQPKSRRPSEPGPVPGAAQRPVRWAEVEAKVFGKICQHCHMNAELNQGRTGPGNGGGFGYPATGIELQTLAGVRAVAHRIPDALFRRRLEASRDFVHPGEHPRPRPSGVAAGMPLGLPPIPDEDISLVLAWIEQGMPE
jgi:mono/diheme cytochrome c family protein